MLIARTPIIVTYAILTLYSSCGLFNLSHSTSSDENSDEITNQSRYTYVSDVDWGRLPSASDLPPIVTGKTSSLKLLNSTVCRKNSEAVQFRSRFESALANEVQPPETKLCTGQNIEIGKTYRNVTPGLVSADGHREQVFSFIARSDNEISMIFCDAETLAPTRASNFVLESTDGASKIEYIRNSPSKSYRLFERTSSGLLILRDTYSYEDVDSPGSNTGTGTPDDNEKDVRTPKDPDISPSPDDSDVNLISSARKYSFKANYDSNGQGVSIEMSFRPTRSFTRQSFFIGDFGMTEFLFDNSKSKVFFDYNLDEISVTALSQPFYDSYGNIGDISLPEENNPDFDVPEIEINQCSSVVVEYDCSGVVDNGTPDDIQDGNDGDNECNHGGEDDNSSPGPNPGWSVATQKHNGYYEKFVTIELSPNSSLGIAQGSYIGLRASVLNPDDSIGDVSEQFKLSGDSDISIFDAANLCGSIERAGDYLQTQPSVRVATSNEDICKIYKNYPVILWVRGQGSPSAPFTMRDGRGSISVQLK